MTFFRSTQEIRTLWKAAFMVAKKHTKHYDPDEYREYIEN